MKYAQKRHRIYVLLSIGLLAGCGGGGSSDSGAGGEEPASRFQLTSHAEVLDLALELGAEREGQS